MQPDLRRRATANPCLAFLGATVQVDFYRTIHALRKRVDSEIYDDQIDQPRASNV